MSLQSFTRHWRVLRSAVAFFCAAAAASVAACSTSNNSPNPASTHLTCSPAGEATPGPADMHCVGQPVQMVDQASCYVDALAPTSADAAEEAADESGATDAEPEAESAEAAAAAAYAAAVANCDYGATMFGPGSDGGAMVVEGDDDDCKYHVSWTSTPICKSSVLGVIFTVTVTYLGTNPPVPVTNLPWGILPEAYIPTALITPCDDATMHISPTLFAPTSGLQQTSPTSGVYEGPVIFDQPGEWTLRFHIHEECSDLLANSPHGHAAFHITVP